MLIVATISLVDGLRLAGYEVANTKLFDDHMGHAGAVIYQPSGVLEGANDPRADGCVTTI